ncbi:MAG: DUF5131 family protein [Vicinamibacterales bacterium]
MRLAGLANVWFGVSVEDRTHGLPRLDALHATPAAVRFLSVEPLLEDLGPLNLAGVDWVIVGGESGPHARPMRKESRTASCSDALAADLIRLSGEGMAPSHLALLLDVAAEAADARMSGAASADLVWTGPEASVAHSRDTSVVVEELFANAQRHVLISTFVVHQGSTMFRATCRQDGPRA